MTEKKLIEHHTKYEEIHGFDETAWMTKSEHNKLHAQLRRSKKCNISVDELRRISKAAHSRTKKSIETRRKYRNSETGKKAKKRHNQTDKKKRTQSKYQRKNIQHIYFTETIGKNAQMREDIYYNNKTGIVTYSSRFKGANKHNLPGIDI